MHSTWMSNPAIFEAILFVISIGAGIFGSILGLGGGIIIVPVLTLIFGIKMQYAVGASIISVIATSSGAAATYVKDHITNIRVAILLEVATTIGALTGAILSTYISTRILFFIFSLILFYSAWIMFKKKKNINKQPKSASHTNDYWANKLKLNSSYPDKNLGYEVFYTVAKVPLAFILMLGAGIISGLLGIGSGVLKVLAMDSAMGLPIKVSSATSNFMIGVTAAASAGAYFMQGNILPMVAAPIALGVLLGSQFGTKIMMKIHSDRIRNLFMGVLLIIALQMFLKTFDISLR